MIVNQIYVSIFHVLLLMLFIDSKIGAFLLVTIYSFRYSCENVFVQGVVQRFKNEEIRVCLICLFVSMHNFSFWAARMTPLILTINYYNASQLSFISWKV